MSTLQPYTPSPLQARRVSRGLANLAIETGLAIAVTESKAEQEAAVIDAITHVGGRAMQDVALMTQMEQQLATAVPLAASRLQGIGDMTTLAVVDRVASAARRIGR